MPNELLKMLYFPLYKIDHPVTLATIAYALVILFVLYIASLISDRLLSSKVLSKYQWKPEIGMGLVLSKGSHLLFAIMAVFLTIKYFGIDPKTIHSVLNYPLYTIKDQQVNLISVLAITIILLLACAVFKHTPTFLRTHLFPLLNLSSGAEYTLTQLSQYFVFLIGILISLNYLGINLQGFALFAGLMSVGLGFGLQNIISNFISGLILLFERPIQIGDRIQIGDTLGDVQAIRIRSTLVRTPDNICMLVPNSTLLSDTLTNWSFKDPKVRIHIPVGVAYGSDVEKVRECLLQVAKQHPNVLDHPASDVWFTEFADSSLNFDLLIWIADPVEQFRISSQLNFAIDAIFRKHDIEIPFPQQDVHIRNMPSHASSRKNGQA